MKRLNLMNQQGQSLIELIVGMTVAVIIIGSATGTAALLLKSNTQAKRLDTATNLSRELSDNLRSFADADWRNLYDLLHGSANHYYLNATSSPFTTSTGDQAVAVESVTYTRYFYVENVNRDLCGAGTVTTDAATACTSGPNTTGVADDPSTQRVTVVATWPGTATGVQLVEYLTRNRNTALTQTDWSGGNSQEGPITEANNKFASSTNINYSGTKGSAQLSGSAPYPSSGTLSSSVFDTSVSKGAALNTVMWQGSQPAGTAVQFQMASSNCSNGSADYPTCSGGPLDQGSGPIDGTKRWAWNEVMGWIDFGYGPGNVNVSTSQLSGYASSTVGEIALDCATTPSGNICATSNFKVSRSGATLSGWAWNDTIGWISFNCSDPGVCATSNYSVSVSTSTGMFSGWAWNDIVGWVSFNCADTPDNCVTSDYKVKVAGQAGGWRYLGPDGTASTYYVPASPNLPIMLNPAYHNNHRYFRYQVRLLPDGSATSTPRVDDVIINWSP